VKNLHVKDPSSGISNLDSLIDQANECGYLVQALLLDACDFGLPQSRQRYYILGFRVSTAAISQRAKDFKMPAWVDELARMIDIMKVQPLPWHNFIFDSMEPGIVDLDQAEDTVPAAKKARNRKTAAAKGKAADDAKVENFECDHNDAYTARGFAYPPCFPPEFAQKTKCLTQRRAELLYSWRRCMGRRRS
jgi:site-specific DNA-cytosine methylase